MAPQSYTTGFSYAVAVFAVALGGWRSAVLSLGLGGLLGTYFFVEPRGLLALPIVSSLVAISTFLAVGVLIAALAGSAQQRHRLEAEAADLRRFKLASENATEAHFLVDGGGRFRYVNRAACEFLGYSQEELLRLCVSDIDPLHDHEAIRAAVREPQGFARPFETVHRRKDGVTLPVEMSVTGVVLDGRPFLFGAARDIRERKRAEKLLRESEERFRIAFQGAATGITLVDSAGRCSASNATLQQMLGYTGEELAAMTLSQLTHPDDLVQESALIQQLFSGRCDHYRMEKRYRRKDGAWVWGRQAISLVRQVGSPAPLAEDTTACCEASCEGWCAIAMVEDITELQTLGEALARRERELSTLLEHAPDVIARYDRGLRHVYVNPAVERILGLSAAEFMGNTYCEAGMRGASCGLLKEKIREVFETGRKTMLEFDLPFPSGRRFYEGALVPEPGGEDTVEYVLAVIREVTERKLIEGRLREAEKLAEAGRLIATIAHEVNNPLEAVTNLLFLLKNDPGLAQPARQWVEIANQELERVTHVTRQSLAFYRDPSRPRPVQLSDIVDNLLRLYQQRIEQRRILVRRRFDFNGAVQALPAEIHHVVANLFLNALQAVPDGGTVAIHVCQARNWGSPEERGVRIVVADNGQGIAPQHVGLLFDPLFTTKDTGTGLGLWVSRAIVRHYDGSIQVRSTTRPGRSGTAFSVFLPATKLAAGTATCAA